MRFSPAASAYVPNAQIESLPGESLHFPSGVRPRLEGRRILWQSLVAFLGRGILGLGKHISLSTQYRVFRLTEDPVWVDLDVFILLLLT